MSLVETQCPKCKKKIFLDLEEIVSESASRPIKCSQCGNEFIFGFDSEAQPVPEEISDEHLPQDENQDYVEAETVDHAQKKKTKLVKKTVVKRVKKEKPKAERRVLIIEDSNLTREQIGEIFSEIVSDVVKVDSAEEGISEIKKGRPDLLIVDLHLPKMSGVEFIHSIRNYIPLNKVIIFTAVQDMFVDIFNKEMAGVELIQKAGPDSFETLREKGIDILDIE
jgi:CheY-like chemotaxis protein